VDGAIKSTAILLNWEPYFERNRSTSGAIAAIGPIE
jgi:hypothetical protein